jgi:hypothetical protein
MGQRDTGSRRDCVDFKFCFRILQRPRLVVNIATVNHAFVNGVETVAFREPAV